MKSATSSSSTRIMLQPLHVEGALAVEIDGVGHASDGQVLDVRCLRAQHAHHLQRLALIFQRLHIVREGEQVYFWRQAHRRMSPVAVLKMPSCPLAATAFTLSCAAFIHCASYASMATDFRPASRRLRDRPWESAECRPSRAPRADRSARCGRAARVQSE